MSGELPVSGVPSAPTEGGAAGAAGQIGGYPPSEKQSGGYPSHVAWNPHFAEGLPADGGEVLLELRDVVKEYPLRGVSRAARKRGEPVVNRAVDGVSLTVTAGATLGLVGESGCGKSTLSRVALGLEPPTSGQVLFDGVDIATLKADQMRRLRRDMQVVLQDPYSSLNPRMTVGQIVAEPFEVHPDVVPKAQRRARVAELLELVGLSADQADRYPHQFSGGQRQRIGIARALALNPRLIIADEPVSALDMSVQAQVLNLMASLQRELSLAYLFISHDLTIVRHVSNHVAVMYAGKIVETGEVEEVFENPQDPYTRELLAAVPTVG